MKVTVIQMVSGTDLSTNLTRAHALLRAAAQAGAELAVLPEYFCLIGQHDADKLAIQEPYGDGPIQRFLADAARELGLWVVGGTVPLSAPLVPGQPAATQRVFNSTLVFSPQGACVARYDKIHLFRFDNGRESYDESRVLAPGLEPVVFELPSQDGHRWRIGLSVCYDLRFPELYRALVADGCTLLSVPAAFTAKTGAVHWHTLLKARAVENLCYVLAPGQCGKHPGGRSTWGHSLILDPWGDTLAEVHGEAPAIAVAILDPNHLDAIRQRFPALSHRRL